LAGKRVGLYGNYLLPVDLGLAVDFLSVRFMHLTSQVIVSSAGLEILKI
jgi:hypothetical protein